MEVFYSFIDGTVSNGRDELAGSINVHYGKDEKAEIIFEKLLKIKDAELRKVEIDKFIDYLEENSDKDDPKTGNGFYSKSKVIYAEKGPLTKSGAQFKIDDNEIYYLFFNNWLAIRQEYPNSSNDAITHTAIRYTLLDYFGQDFGNVNKRQKLLQPEINSNEIAAKSIQILKREHCALCTEKATVANNLWIISGNESYCIDGPIDFSEIGIYDEEHQFLIVKSNDGTYRLFDYAMGFAKLFDENENPIDVILKGSPLVYENKFGETLKYCCFKNQKNR